MTNTEIKELIAILKQEGCNSKKQAIEYLEGKLKTFKKGERIEIINPRYSYKKTGKILDILGNSYIIVETDDKQRFCGCLVETDLEVKE